MYNCHIIKVGRTRMFASLVCIMWDLKCTCHKLAMRIPGFMSTKKESRWHTILAVVHYILESHPLQNQLPVGRRWFIFWFLGGENIHPCSEANNMAKKPTAPSLAAWFSLLFYSFSPEWMATTPPTRFSYSTLWNPASWIIWANFSCEGTSLVS